MQERQVTAGQDTMKLPEPFFVIATQNPIEQEGTYPLPEAQLDRFMFNIKVDYPEADDEKLIVSMSTRGDKPELTKVLSGERITAWQKLVKKIEVPGFVNDFIVKLVRATRPKDPSSPDMIKRLVDWGAGPRAGIFLAQAGQAFAAMDGRPSVAIDDVKKAAVPVLRHRVSANFQAQAEGKNSDDIVAELLKIVSEPEPSKYAARKKG
jgi:MoxR-like ATPase